jgi:hypothetical protein
MSMVMSPDAPYLEMTARLTGLPCRPDFSPVPSSHVGW